MIKFYIPDGHLEKKTLELLRRAGFRVGLNERGYNPTIDDPEVILKRIRPQDFPFTIALGKGDMAITGQDIVKEFSLEYRTESKAIIELLYLGYGTTKLVAAVSKDVYPDVQTIEDFRKETGSRKPVVASEYPNISREYLKGRKINAIVRKPYGKTEGWLLPPTPEADMVIDTVETGKTLLENNCRILDTVMESSAILIANRESAREKKKKIMEIVELLRGAIDAQNKVTVFMNVMEPKNLNKVLKVLEEYVEKPTISQLSGGGYDIFVILDERELRYALPKLRASGASGIAVSDMRMIL